MKRINLQALLAVALLTLLTACVREPALEMEGGNAICFSASASVTDDMPMTRTVYGSVSGSTKNILWTAGDRVTIWSPDAVVVSGGVATHPAASYGIAGQNTESAYGKATGISPVTSGVALQWGTAATHTFYGKFPDPAWSGAAPYAHDAFKNQDPASASFLCWLPASVSVTPETGVFDYTEDMTYCYMTAFTSSAQRNVAVDLDFSQAVSAFRVNLPHAFRNGALSVSRVEISSASHRLNGEYTVGIAASNTYTVSESSLTAADKSVSMVFSSPVMIPNGNVLSVTLFACPVGAADLTLKLTEVSGIERTIPLKTPGGEWISFQPGKYYEINVGEIPSGPVHVFSINDQGGTVSIAPGNLMARIESYAYPTATASEWKFGEPWEYVGSGTSDGNYLFFNANASCVGKWVDMFSWQGESSTDNTSSRVHGLLNQTSDFKQYNGNVDGEPTYDGCWNSLPITNGGGYNWRPLSNAEWIYLLNTRSCAYRYAKGQVHGVNGLIIFPDSFTLPSGVTINSYNTASAAYTSNTLSNADWAKLEGNGAVFMPAAGWGKRPDITDPGDYGSYWTSTASNFNGAYGMSFSNTGLATNDSAHRYRGECVRLARDIVPGFSVGANRKVVIARGNLMAKIGSYSFPVATASEWKFGEPWESIGNGSSTGNYLFGGGDNSCVGKWVDLFSWQGASSINDASHRVHGLVNLSYDSQFYHGDVDGEPVYDGCWNGLPITNGGGYYWRPLTKDEWTYLWNTRTVTNSLSADARYTLATIDGNYKGMIIFPDKYTHPSGTGFTAGTYNTYSNFTATVSMEGWNLMEAAGCVFLPVTGWRNSGSTITDVTTKGLYFTATGSDYVAAYNLNFQAGGVNPGDSSHRFRGMAVRLARDL